MNLLNIAKKADRLVQKNFRRLIYIYLIIEIVMLMLRLIPNEIVAILAGVLAVTIPHVYVVTSLKIIDQQENTIHINDIFVGITQFAKLFPAYIMRKVSLNIFSFALIIPALILISKQTSYDLGQFIDWIRLITVDGMENLTTFFSTNLQIKSVPLALSLACSSILTSILSFCFAMIPYLIERYEISWNEAIMKSWKMMKGHKRDLLFLQFLYIPRCLIYILILNFISLIPSHYFIGITLQLVLSIYLPILLWLPQLQVATALFFEELQEKEKKTNF